MPGWRVYRAHPNRYLQYPCCMLRPAIHVQSRRCQFSIVKDPQIMVTISFLSKFLIWFAISVTYPPYPAILAGASPTLLCAAEDAIRELTENWEPPPEGAGCIYQPPCCVWSGVIRFSIFWGGWNKILRRFLVWKCIVHCLGWQYNDPCWSDLQLVFFWNMDGNEVGGTAARVSWASAGTGRCGKRRVTWFIMVGIVWLLVTHEDLHRICRGFSWNQLFMTQCFRETAYQAPMRSDESYAVALQVREACAAEAEPLDPGSRM